MQKIRHPNGYRIFWYAGRDSFTFSPLREKIMVLPPSRPAASNSPPDCCIEWVESPGYKKKAAIPNGITAFLVRRKGLEPLTY